MIRLPSGEAGAYTQLAEGVRQFGDDVVAERHELWRRMIFSLPASNYDDHLRNHGFLMHRAGRWALSPAYDLNPAPEIERARTPKTAIDEDDSDSSIDVALAVSKENRIRERLRAFIDGRSPAAAEMRDARGARWSVERPVALPSRTPARVASPPHGRQTCSTVAVPKEIRMKLAGHGFTPQDMVVVLSDKG